MVSSTQQFERIRKRKQTTAGKRNKRERRRIGTPAFPVHPEGLQHDGRRREEAGDEGLRGTRSALSLRLASTTDCPPPLHRRRSLMPLLRRERRPRARPPTRRQGVRMPMRQPHTGASGGRRTARPTRRHSRLRAKATTSAT